MNKTLATLISTALLAATLAGCAGIPTPVGSKVAGNIPVGNAREVSGSACGFQLLLFIPININDRLQRANNELNAAAAGDFVTDVQIQESWSYAFVGTTHCTTLKAKAIKGS